MYKGAVGTRQATRMEVEKVSKVKPNAQPELEKKQLEMNKAWIPPTMRRPSPTRTRQSEYLQKYINKGSPRSMSSSYHEPWFVTVVCHPPSSLSH